MRISDWSSDVCSSDLKEFAISISDRSCLTKYIDDCLDTSDDAARIGIQGVGTVPNAQRQAGFTTGELHERSLRSKLDRTKFVVVFWRGDRCQGAACKEACSDRRRSEEHTSELQ